MTQIFLFAAALEDTLCKIRSELRREMELREALEERWRSERGAREGTEEERTTMVDAYADLQARYVSYIDFGFDA